jgi:1-acyl-sn-glycerol-3-phosphate acyltransferase
MYFVGSEHISRWGRIYKLLQYCFAPIMRPKGALASTTVIEMLRKVRGGANVCLFAEGVRSWDGAPAPILPSTGKMVKSARCGLVTYRITGGYFVSVDTVDGLAKRTLALCKEAGVVMTGAGATFPYGKDPQDSNLRIAPSLPPVEELQAAAEVFCVCALLAAVEKRLENV